VAEPPEQPASTTRATAVKRRLITKSSGVKVIVSKVA
jgi:hypothetical protein